MDLSDDTMSEIQKHWESISSLPNKFHRDAWNWWHTTAHPVIKASVISATYYEVLSHMVDEDVESMLESEGEVE